MLRCRLVILLELDLDVAILRADGTGVVVGHVDAAHRHADIVDQRLKLLWRDDLAYGFFDIGKLTRSIFNARAHLRAHVHEDLTGIHERKEITT